MRVQSSSWLIQTSSLSQGLKYLSGIFLSWSFACPTHRHCLASVIHTDWSTWCARWPHSGLDTAWLNKNSTNPVPNVRNSRILSNQHPPTTCNESFVVVSAVKNKSAAWSMWLPVLLAYWASASWIMLMRVNLGNLCSPVASMSMYNWQGLSFAMISYSVACLCARKAWCSLYML